MWAAATVVVAVAAISLTMYHKLGAYDAVQLGESAKVLREADADPTALGDLVMRLRTRVAATPSDLESWYLLGHTLMRLDDAPGAVSAFEHVYAEEPDDPSVQVALAQARFVADRGTVTDENRALIDRILGDDPQQAVALEILALDAFRKADYATAARHLQNAIAGGSAGARTDALKQGLERARALLGDAVGPSLDVTIELGDAARDLPPGAALFVSARKPGERMPLLVARRPVDAATMTVRLDRTNAMQGDVTLNEGETLNVAARVSASGALSVGADDPHASQDGVTLSGGVTPVRLTLGAAASDRCGAGRTTARTTGGRGRRRASECCTRAGRRSDVDGAGVRDRAGARRSADADCGARARSDGFARATGADRSRCDAAESRIEHVSSASRCSRVCRGQVTRCVNPATWRAPHTCSTLAAAERLN